MTEQTKTDEISAILAFPFQDEKWVGKFAVGTGLILISFIPLLNIFSIVLFLGYLAEIIRIIVVEGDPPRLPEWDDLSAFFKDGFMLFGVGLIYSLPSFVLIGIGYLAMIVPAFSMEYGGMSEAEGMGLFLVGYAGGFLLFGFGALLSMAVGFVSPAAICHVVVEGKFGAAFAFKDWWKIFTANWSGFLVAFLILFGGGIVLSYGAYFLVITVVLCCLYPIVTGVMSVYLGIIGMTLFANAYRKGVENLSLDGSDK